MILFGYEIRRILDDASEIRRDTLEKAEQNAYAGLIHAQLELRHHTLLLEEAPSLGRTEAEIQGYTDAIERDKKSINNWQTQLKAINHERNT